MTTQKTQTEPTVENEPCIGVHELIDWQIIQYRKAVDAHRIDLSKAEGRCVSWQEAEKDFSSSDRNKLNEKHRAEYCEKVCTSRSTCMVALRFYLRTKAERLSRVG